MSQAAQQALQTLRAQAQALAAGTLPVREFVAVARGHAALLQALPPRYGEVLHTLLDRLESGALFTEESCSFSQRDLQDSIAQWLDKAGERLAG